MFPSCHQQYTSSPATDLRNQLCLISCPEKSLCSDLHQEGQLQLVGVVTFAQLSRIARKILHQIWSFTQHHKCICFSSLSIRKKEGPFKSILPNPAKITKEFFSSGQIKKLSYLPSVEQKTQLLGLPNALRLLFLIDGNTMKSENYKKMLVVISDSELNLLHKTQTSAFTRGRGSLLPSVT